MYKTKKTKRNSNPYRYVKLLQKNDDIKIYKNVAGTRVVLMPNRSDASSISIYFYLKVGNKYEPVNILGISHLIEHMVYKGTTHFKTYYDISRTLDAAGISYNAFTAKDMTAYFYKFLSNEENIDLVCKITNDMLFQSIFREKDLRLEREVVIEEYKDDKDDIDEEIDDLIDETILSGHPLSRTIIGTPKTLHHIDRATLREFYEKYYTSENLVIGISGNIPSNIMGIIEKNFGGKFIGINKELVTTPTLLVPFQDKQDKCVLKYFRRNLNQDNINIIFKTKGFFAERDNVKHMLIKNILGANMSSRLFVEVREKLGLVYSINCNITNYEEVGMFEITMQSEAKDTARCIDKVLEELVKIKNQRVSFQELSENKHNLCDAIIGKFDDIQVENEYYGKQVLFNKPLVTIKEKIEMIMGISEVDIKNACEELFNFNKMNIVWFGECKYEDVERIIKKYS